MKVKRAHICCTQAKVQGGEECLRAWTRRVEAIISQKVRDVACGDENERRLRAWTRRVKAIVSQKMRDVARRATVAEVSTGMDPQRMSKKIKKMRDVALGSPVAGARKKIAQSNRNHLAFLAVQ